MTSDDSRSHSLPWARRHSRDKSICRGARATLWSPVAVEGVFPIFLGFCFFHNSKSRVRRTTQRGQMFAATKALLRATADPFAGDFETDLPSRAAVEDIEEENPFGGGGGGGGKDDDDKDDLPLLRATRDILEEDNEPAADIVARAREVHYAGIEFDRLMLDRAVDAEDWPRASLAARRILQTAENPKPPDDVVALRTRVDHSNVPTPDDRRAFETAFAHADWTMARLIGLQIVDFETATTTVRVVDV
mmetsp:Transcript_983/g.3343  ORF Transcript_983/g.3343 Transcript_983/m.3343 type:complete len:248 (-) Transcript_983:116-859(-)